MASRSRPRIPSYRLHKATGLAVVRLSGRDIYLGKFGTAESKQRYETVIAEWLAGERLPILPADGGLAAVRCTVNELILAFMTHADGYYRKNGKPTSEIVNFRMALRPVASLYGRTPASEFGPRALRAVREAMIASGSCRGTVNARVKRVRQVFKWGVEQETVPSSVLQGLQAVAPLRRGRCDVREAEPVRPVEVDRVERTIAHASPPVAAMIRLQLLTGMRPGEVVAMRARDIDSSAETWVYAPAAHKTEHHGRRRSVYLGPRAREVLRPFLGSHPDQNLFRPRDALEWRSAQRRRDRQTPMTPSQAARKRKQSPLRAAGECYSTAAYARAVQYSCDRAFPAPPGLNEREATEWRKQHRWSPNQLRHTAATDLRRRYGLDAARVILGHASPTITEIYAELDEAQAVEVMAAIG